MLRWMPVMALALVLVSASPAKADEQVATAGAVSATFSFEPDGDYGYTDLWLTITRGGTVLYDEPVSADGCEDPRCFPGAYEDDSVKVADLDGDGEPEVVLNLYWGGAHCCTIAQVFSFDGTGYRIAERNLGNPGYHLADVDGNGTSEIVTADNRFAYRYTAYAFSIMPVQVLAWDGRRWNDATPAHLGLVREDLHQTWKLLKKAQRRGGYEPRGAAAAWAADRYRLGKRRSTLKALRRMARAGGLEGYSPRSASKFVSTLDRFLVRAGYAKGT